MIEEFDFCTSKAASDSSSEACNSSFSISIFFLDFWSSWTLFPPSESWSVRSAISSVMQKKHQTKDTNEGEDTAVESSFLADLFRESSSLRDTSYFDVLTNNLRSQTWMVKYHQNYQIT